MSKFELKLPQMGESIAEATLTAWLKEVGDTIELDEAVFEIATDKVDSEVPSEVEGVLLEKLFSEDDVIKVGQTVAIIQTEGGEESTATPEKEAETAVEEEVEEAVQEIVKTVEIAKETAAPATKPVTASSSSRFYSPLVRNIAQKEGVSMTELDAIIGSGKEGRVTKNDIMAYLNNGRSQTVKESTPEPAPVPVQQQPMAPPPEPIAEVVPPPAPKIQPQAPPTLGAKDEIIPMTRMGKLIAQHMAHSISTSAHVQSFVEADVTGVVQWRDEVKAAFEKREGEKLTFTPIFMEAVAKALKQHPMLNISVDGENVIVKKNINIGMAVALEDGNLIVPVIKNADQLNLVGMAKVINDLAFRSRNNTLKPDEVQDGTYTVTNVGSFGSLMGTPIINQPQVGILALGAIRKVPAVIETPDGDYIGVRNKMFLSHSYDHRVVNGALGGTFVKTVADILENWDLNREY